MTMLAPDVLDRRALALLRLTDVFGRAVAGPVRIEGEGVRTFAKASGDFAVLAAAGLEEHVSAFLAPPAAPALLSRHVAIDLTPAARDVAPRRFDLRLPRDPAMGNADQPDSLFRPIEIEMLPSPGARTSGSACAVRVAVRRKDDGRLVAYALVRARSDNGQFTARAVTDARGEACLVFPTLPLAFPGAGAAVQPDLPARVVATVDPEVARFHRPTEAAAAFEADAMRTINHPDPDAIGAEAPDFDEGTEVRLSAGRAPGIVVEWEQP
jgi:hypothetical protein